MPIFIARIYRIIPLIVVLALAAGIAYAVAARSNNGVRVTQVVLKAFWWLCAVGSAFFVLATLYALADGNAFAAELFISCAAVFAVGWVIDLLCAWRFRVHHPGFKVRPTRPKPRVKR